MSKRDSSGASASLIQAEGLVQGVGFRRFVQRQARDCKVAGFVENMKDGSVMIFAQGKRSDIEKLVGKLRSAPRPAEVDAVRKSEAKPRPSLKIFQIKVGTLATEFQEGFGGMETEFRDYRREFGEFSGRTQENFDLLATKYGEISVKLTQILHELQTENRDAINSLNTSVNALLKAVEKLGPAR
ncbi:MAG TPA: acylphosphatase [Nitrososphaerales archaeon]|nr:acylphosphatase [Nitrososphaerales archaeon]